MKYWKTKDGTKIAYSKLEDSHLLNILKWVEKRAEEGVIQGSCGYSGDDDYMTGDIWTEYGDDVLKMFDYGGLKREAKRRAIK